MQFNLEGMAAADRYELLLGTIVPRPIAMITTLSKDGALNCAPYSLFNVIGHDPPLLMISILPHAENRLKDTANNILETRDFTVSLVSESIAEAMNVACIDAPQGINELELAKLETSASVAVAPPRVAQSPVAFECRLLTSLSFGSNQSIVIGQIVHAFIADRFVISAERGVIDTPKLELIGAMHGAKWYARMSDRFAMERPSWQQWASTGKVL